MGIPLSFTENYRSVRYMGRYFVRKRIFLCFWWWDMENTPLGGYKDMEDSINKAYELSDKNN